ncbi:MAG: HDOD domain-containing protein, partial [Proteobacteria bacterium]|nr:HDOD domain-containing protein [Pseudomonadota bacterium]
MRIIELAQDPEIDIARVARTISLDPALTTRVLRTANSPLYAQRRRCANLHQAMVVLGLNATLTLALSFTLAGTLRGQKPRSIDYPFYWSRALISALAARALGEALGQPRAEELFLAGLLQDVGILALDQALPEMYLNTAGLQRDHHALAEFERKRLGTDHASIGGRLMNAWNLPERLHRAISISHVMEQSRAATTDALAHRCVALSGLIADLYLVEPERRDFQQVALATGRSLGLGRPAFGQLLRTIGTLIPDTASLFDTD